jgi:hypothetical protein
VPHAGEPLEELAVCSVINLTCLTAQHERNQILAGQFATHANISAQRLAP